MSRDVTLVYIKIREDLQSDGSKTESVGGVDYHRLYVPYKRMIEKGERVQFFELIGRNIIDQRQAGLLTQLTLGQVPGETGSQEISVVPLSEGKFFVDGESVDCRTIKIKYLTDSISMFVPRNTIPVESVNILPEIPRSISNFMQTLHDFFGIG